MKVLIVSDTHGKNDNLRRVLHKLDGHIDLLIHLGDFLGSPEALQDMAPCSVEIVRGNCDSALGGAPIAKLIRIGEHTALITHGHQYGVKYSVETLKEAARENGADIAMYGHTHEPYLSVSSDDVTVLNPGSLSQPRQDGHRPTYMVMTLREDGKAEYSLVKL